MIKDFPAGTTTVRAKLGIRGGFAGVALDLALKVGFLIYWASSGSALKN